MLCLLRNPEHRKQMDRAARNTLGEYFGMRAMMNRLMDTYDELLAAKHV
jgi:hypothetical protein